MRILLTILSLWIYSANATNYFVSATGSDAAAGTSAGTAWQTIGKVNGTTLAAGDNVFFKRGDTFLGTLIISQSGGLGNPITYGAYGTGLNPIITGFATVGAWTSLGSNQWESTSAISTLPLANVVTINGVSVPMGRTPNTSGGYLQYTNHVGNTQITTGLTGTPNYTGAEAVIRFQNWIISRDSITAQSLGTLTYTAGTGIPYTNGQSYNGINNWGFFIQNYLPACDTVNEWFYNRSTKKLDLFSVGSPSATVQVATVDTLVVIRSHDNITLDNLQFTGANSYAFWITKSKNISITHCNLDNNYDGVIGVNFFVTNASSGFTFNLDSITHTSNKAMDLSSEFSTATITNNLVRSTGYMPGMGGSGDGQYQGINVQGVTDLVQYNEVDSTGYVGIGFKGSSISILNNYVHNYCFVKDDGGGIYFQQAATSVLVDHNVCINGIGASAGTAAGFSGNILTKAHGIYFDDLSSGGIISNNTTANNSYSGIYLHNNTSVQVLNNTSYNNRKTSLLLQDDNATTRGGLVIKNNIFFQRDSTDNVNLINFCIVMASIYNDLGSILTMDSNYFCRPIADNTVFDIDPSNGGGTHTFYTLATWQALYGYDTHSNKSPKPITTITDLSFNYNQTGSPSTQSLSNNYIDVFKTNYNNTITLQAYLSAVLTKSPIPGGVFRKKLSIKKR